MKVYLDHHATTPVDPAVLEAMLPYFREEFGNASSVTHSLGLSARAAVAKARETLAQAIGADDPEEIVFTSGATESDNLAVLGAAHHARKDGKDHLVTVVTEHKAVLDSMKALDGFRVTYLPVDSEGFVDLRELEKAVTPKTILVSVMHANNEIGVIQPIDEIGAICRAKKVFFHTDAAQSFGKIPFTVNNVDLASLSAHKIYGPKGVGALYVRKANPRVKLDPIVHGGGHERGLRSGTLNVPGIVGFARAATLPERNPAPLRDRLLEGIRRNLDRVKINGSLEHRLPGNLNCSFEHVEGEALTIYLNERGIAVSTGSACSSAVLEPSHVLKAIGRTEPEIYSSIRFGLGRFNTEKDIDYVIETLVAGVRKLRAMSPLAEEKHG